MVNAILWDYQRGMHVRITDFYTLPLTGKCKLYNNFSKPILRQLWLPKA